MQQFTLIHDGSDQAWQAAYLAFHIATRLGAPLVALLFDPTSDAQKLTQRAAQIEIGARAAGVVIRTRILGDFSLEAVAELSVDSNGIFIPHRLLTNEITVRRYLETLSRPLWIVSKGSELRGIAVLVNDFQADGQLVHDTITLAQRTNLSLTGIVREKEPALTSMTWVSLADFSLDKITAALNYHGISLLFLPASVLSIVADLSIDYVVYPVPKNA